MAEYPDWLMRYKTKGVYVKKLKSGYALYKGHSQRVEGKKYPVFKCDEYLGIVTEHDGLRPPSPPVRPDIRVLRYGLFCVAEALCGVLRRPVEDKGLDAALVYAHCLLRLEGLDTEEGYRGSWLCERYPRLNMRRALSDEESQALDRMMLQMESKFTYGLGKDHDLIVSLAHNTYAVYVNGGWHLSTIPEKLSRLAEKYKIDITIKKSRA